MGKKTASVKRKSSSVSGQNDQQPSLFGDQTEIPWRTIATNQTLLEAWSWIYSEINDRPTSSQTLCYFDHKLWGGDQGIPLQATSPFIDHVATLYLITELGDLQQAMELARGVCTSDLGISSLDPDCQKLFQSSDRFRVSLSEHLSFWITLAMEARNSSVKNFARSRPNLKPERQGPDGVTISMLDDEAMNSIVRVHSIKSSIHNPKSLVSTAKFRNNQRAADADSLLDGFWLISRLGRSFNELDECLSAVCNLMQLSAAKRIRTALLHECIYDATVVADDAHANIALFEGYQHVVDDVARRAATYIGASNWQTFSEATRWNVINALNRAGVWI